MSINGSPTNLKISVQFPILPNLAKNEAQLLGEAVPTVLETTSKIPVSQNKGKQLTENEELHLQNCSTKKQNLLVTS